MSEVFSEEGNFQPLTFQDDEIQVDNDLLNKQKSRFFFRWFFPSNWKAVFAPNLEPHLFYESNLTFDLGLRPEDPISQSHKINLPDNAYQRLWKNFNAASLAKNLEQFNKQKKLLVEYENTLQDLLSSVKWWPKSWLFARNRAGIAQKLQIVKQKRAILEQHAVFCAGVAANYLNAQIGILAADPTRKLIQSIKQTTSTIKTAKNEPEFVRAHAVIDLIKKIDNPAALLERASEYIKETKNNPINQEVHLKNAEDVFKLAIEFLKDNKPTEQQAQLENLKYFREWADEIFSNIMFRVVDGKENESSEVALQQAERWNKIKENSGLDESNLKIIFNFIKKFFRIDPKCITNDFDCTLSRVYHFYVNSKSKNAEEVEQEIYKAYAFYLLCNDVLLPKMQKDYVKEQADNNIVISLKIKIENYVKTIGDFTKKTDEIERVKSLFFILKKLLIFLGKWDEDFDNRLSKAEGKREKDRLNKNIESFRKDVRELYHLSLNKDPQFAKRYSVFLKKCAGKIFSELPDSHQEILDFFKIIINNKPDESLFGNSLDKSVAKIIEKITKLDAYLNEEQDSLFSIASILVLRCQKDLDGIVNCPYADRSLFPFYLSILIVYKPELVEMYSEKEEKLYQRNGNDARSIYSFDFSGLSSVSLPIIEKTEKNIIKRTYSASSGKSAGSMMGADRAAEANLLKMLLQDNVEVKQITYKFIRLLNKSLKNINQWNEIIRTVASKKDIEEIIKILQNLYCQLCNISHSLIGQEAAVDLLNTYLSRLTEHLDAWYMFFLSNYKNWGHERIICFADSLLGIPDFNDDIIIRKKDVEEILNRYREENIVAKFSAAYSSAEFSLKTIDDLKFKADLINQSSFLEIKSTFLEVFKKCISQTLTQLSINSVILMDLKYENNKITPIKLIATINCEIEKAIEKKISNLSSISSTIQKKNAIKIILQGLAVLKILNADAKMVNNIKTQLESFLPATGSLANIHGKPSLPTYKPA